MKTIICCFALILVSFAMQAQTIDYNTLLQGSWRLDKVDKAGAIIYDWQNTHLSPLYRVFSGRIAATLFNKTNSENKYSTPTDTLEAAFYTVKNDTLLLDVYYKFKTRAKLDPNTLFIITTITPTKLVLYCPMTNSREAYDTNTWAEFTFTKIAQ